MQGPKAPLELTTATGESFRDACPGRNRGVNDFRQNGSVYSPLVILSLVWLVMSVATWGEAPQGKQEPPQQTVAPESRAKITKAIILTDDDAQPRLVKEVDLGGFRPGTEIQCILTITNATRQTLDFNEIEKNCTCLSVSPQNASLGVGETLDLEISIQTPLKASQAMKEVSIHASRNRVLLFTLRLQYVASGVVGFPGTMIRLGIPDGKESERLAIDFFTDPQSPEAVIELAPSESLSSIEFRLDYLSKQVVANVPAELVKHGRIAGLLRIRNIETWSHDQIVIDVYQESAVSIHPSLLRFVETDSDEGTFYTANVLVHDKIAHPTSSLHAAFTLDGHAVPTKLIHQRGGAYFYRLTIAKAQDDQMDLKNGAEIQCEIMANRKQKSIYTLPVLVVARSALPN